MKMPKMLKNFLSYCSNKFGWGAAGEESKKAQDQVLIIEKSTKRIEESTLVVNALTKQKQALNELKEAQSDFINDDIVRKFDQHMNKLEGAYLQKNGKRMTPELRETAEGLAIKKLSEADANTKLDQRMDKLEKAYLQRNGKRMTPKIRETAEGLAIKKLSETHANVISNALAKRKEEALAQRKAEKIHVSLDGHQGGASAATPGGAKLRVQQH